MHLIQHGVPLKVVQAYAGHSRLETTETYTRVFALDINRLYSVRIIQADSHFTVLESFVFLYFSCKNLNKAK